MRPEIAALASLVQHTQEGGAVVVPRSLAAAIVEAAAPVAAPAVTGSGPNGDFTSADLMGRFRRSASWVRERMTAGDFGTPYAFGRERIVRSVDVLAYEASLRETGGSAHDLPPTPARPRRTTSPGRSSLSAARRRAER